MGEAVGGGPAVAVAIIVVGLTPGAAGGASADYGFVEGGEAITAVVAVGGKEVEVAACGLWGPLAGLDDVAVVGAGTIGPFEAELVVGGGAAGLEEVGVGADSLALELEEVVVFGDFVEAVAELPTLGGSVGGVFGICEIRIGRDYGCVAGAVA